MKKAFLSTLLLVVATVAMAIDFNQEILLYPNGAPDDNGITAPETTQDGWWFNVSVAKMYTYLPSGTAKGTVLVIPGGGYGGIAFAGEGIDVAERLVAKGWAAVILKYRLPNGHNWIPLEDACQAMEMLRLNATTYGLNPKGTFGVAGFSAGGHLASTLVTKYRSLQARPDYGMLFYPVISMDPAITHPDTRTNLLGTSSPTEQLINEWSSDKCANESTPPCLLALSQNDELVSTENSVRMYNALTAKKVIGEMLIFPDGAHGWGGKRADFTQRDVLEDAVFQFMEAVKAQETEPGSLLPAGVIADITPGRPVVKEKNIVVAGSPSKGYRTYFAANDMVNGQELWTTDGTTLAYMVKDINPGANGSSPSWIKRFNDKVVFKALVGDVLQTWISDGTEAGTRQLLDKDGRAPLDPYGFCQLNENQFIFIAEDNTYDLMWKLYVSDGTNAGTQIIYSAANDPGFTGYFPGHWTTYETHDIFTRVGRKVFFKAVDDAANYELWVTDGTTAGTKRLTDLNADWSKYSSSSFIAKMINYKNQYLFFGGWNGFGHRMYMTDGNTVTEMQPSETLVYVDDADWYRCQAIYNDKLYHAAWSQTHGVELFSSNTKGQSTLVKDIRTGDANAHSWPDILGEYDGNLMLVANDGDCHLFRYNDKDNSLTKHDGWTICFNDNGYEVVNGSFYTYGLVNGYWSIFRMDNASANPVQVREGDGLGYGIGTAGYNLRNCGGKLIYSYTYGDPTHEAVNKGVFVYNYCKEGGVAENLEPDFDVPTPPTAISETTNDASSIKKMVKNGQLLINKNGIIYNAQGIEVK